MTTLKFTRSECSQLKQYIYLGVTNPRANQTMTLTQENNTPKPLNVDAIYDADKAGITREVILVNKDGYKAQDVIDFANKFNARSTEKKITHIMTMKDLAVERAIAWN